MIQAWDYFYIVVNIHYVELNVCILIFYENKTMKQIKRKRV